MCGPFCNLVEKAKLQAGKQKVTRGGEETDHKPKACRCDRDNPRPGGAGGYRTAYSCYCI